MCIFAVAVKLRCKQVKECGQKPADGATLGEGGAAGVCSGALLRVMMLLEFVEALERGLLMASDGCASSLIPVSKVMKASGATDRWFGCCIY